MIILGAFWMLTQNVYSLWKTKVDFFKFLQRRKTTSFQLQKLNEQKKTNQLLQKKHFLLYRHLNFRISKKWSDKRVQKPYENLPIKHVSSES